MPRELQVKNISYHPESDTIPRFEAAPEVKQRVEQILRTHGQRVEAFLRRSCPDFVPGWTLGTTSFRSIEEQGRNLKPRSSNELVHVDAGAYGATNGARILRFFVNIHPSRNRVWGTKGSFNAIMDRHRELWDAAKGGHDARRARQGAVRPLYSGLVGAVSKVYPIVHVIDSSPYDRSMRRIHNYMKENPSFRDNREGYQEIHFPPLSAWMVFTDGISHSVLTGQHALVTTVLIPLANAASRSSPRTTCSRDRRPERSLVATVHFTPNLARHIDCPTANARGRHRRRAARALFRAVAERARLRARRPGRGPPAHQSARRRAQYARPPALEDALAANSEVFVFQALSGG